MQERDDAEITAGEASDRAEVGRSGRVLVVDDEAAIVLLLQEVLAQYPYWPIE
jgi:hypothetical protein